MINLKTKKILVPFDFTETSENAIKNAAFIAAITKGELIILNVQKKNELLDLLLPKLNINKPNALSELISEKLSAEATQIQKTYGVKTTSIFSSGKNIANEIVNISMENDIDLIVMGTQGGSSSSDLFTGSNTYRTLTKSELPILTIRNAPPKKGYANIVLPIDLSAHTRQKVNVALQFAKLFGAKIYVIGIYNDSEKTDKFKIEVYVRQIEKEAKKQNVSINSDIVKTGNKVKKTLFFAKKVSGDVIIAMTDQDSEFKSVLLGNYIHQLINNSKIPVLCLKPELGEITEGGTPGVPF
ncbi:MAG: universal stress protein [Bacteroidota bacterium]|jgi:nucleotide-binding universal stress UspA family protein